MRYFVTIGGREMEVELGPEGILVDGEEVVADLVEMDGTEVHSLLLGGKSHRVLASRSAVRSETVRWPERPPRRPGTPARGSRGEPRSRASDGAADGERGVGDGHAGLAAGVEVDRVEPDAVPRDDLRPQ